jgi:DNA replication protein DnaC
VRFYSTVNLVNLLEREKYEGKAGRIAQGLRRTDLVILDELGYLPFSQSGGALLKLYKHTSVVITTNLSFSEWSSVLFDNTARSLRSVSENVQQRHIVNCSKADPEYGTGVARSIAKYTDSCADT